MAGTETLFERLRPEIGQMPVIDSHEHTRSERERMASPPGPDQLGYLGCDICAAGATWQESEALENAANDPAAAREVILKYWPVIRTTGYGRSIERTLRGVFGIGQFNRQSYDELAVGLRDGITDGSYEHWFRDKYNIQATVLDVDSDEDYSPLFFRGLRHTTHFVLCDSRHKLEELERRTGNSIHSASQMRDAMWSYLERLTKEQPRVVALKNNLAYNRSLDFKRTTLAEADRAFNLLFADKYARHAQSWIPSHHRSYDELAALQNFLVHESVRFAGEHKLVYQIHTGLQAGYSNRITDGDPTHLINLVSEYHEVKFVLFHGGFPYGREWGVLGKNFPNVFLDLCWMHIISPATTVQMLDEWLDYLPSNKIFGFGGDLKLVESIYGHLEIARDNIARALARKVSRGDYDTATALEIARRMLFDNPNDVFGLGIAAPVG
jgi:uncharacterized protein